MTKPLIYDITAAVVEEDGVIMALFDNRYNAIKVIRALVVELKNDAGEVVGHKPRLEAFDPDGAERVYWLEKFGMITEEELAEEAAKLKGVEKEKLYNRLEKELDKPDTQAVKKQLSKVSEQLAARNKELGVQAGEIARLKRELETKESKEK